MIRRPPPPPPPAVDGGLRDALFDTECFPNYWLLKFRPIGGVSWAFEIHDGESFSTETRQAIAHLFGVYRVISFNGLGYDQSMITAALCGFTTAQLKWLNDQIIVEKIKPWDLNLPEWTPLDHIDVMETAPGAGSLKQYAARIHSRTIRDLPYKPDQVLTMAQKVEVAEYCEIDLDDLGDLYRELRPQLQMREKIGAKYGIDLRSKSDAQMAETVIKKRCEQALGRRLFKSQIDWNLQFMYRVPEFISFELPQLKQALELVRASVFRLGPTGSVLMPPQLEGLEITIGQSTYKMGIGGLHSQEKQLIAVSDDKYLIRMPDVASYYPNLMINSGEFPLALGATFIQEFVAIKDERLLAKALAKRLEKAGFKGTVEHVEASTEDGGGKIMINGTFGKTGSIYSILFAPTMLIQTTITGQLSLLMLIGWLEHYAIPVISANTDGLVVKCPRDRIYIFDHLISEWQKRTGLEMETEDYLAIYARDVNNYFAIKTATDIKRKGEYAKAGLVEKKNPDVEICSDAVAEFLAKGVPIAHTVTQCRDIRKFITIQKVAGGGVKMWGEGPRKGALVREMAVTLEANGWIKSGRKWVQVEGSPTGGSIGGAFDTATAYRACFAPQVPEYLGKVVRWYYSTQAPGPIVYATNGNTVSLSYGARPCMTLPDTFPTDIDYDWYVEKCDSILRNLGYYRLGVNT